MDFNGLRRRSLLIQLLHLPLILAGCSKTKAPPPETRILPTLFPTRTAPHLSPTATDPNDTGWLTGEPGVELRHLRIPHTTGTAIPLIIARFQQEYISLRIGYQPEQPASLRHWFATAQPILAMNAGYFTPEHQSAALVISDGIAYGESYAGFGGMLAVHQDGTLELRPLRDIPYDASESLQQAIQCSPMLIFPGGVIAELNDNGERARRSVVAFDQSGRLLCIIGPTSSLTLSELAHWLANSDLAIERALNLDGGSSTGLFVQSGSLHEAVDSFTQLPIVLLVHHRST